MSVTIDRIRDAEAAFVTTVTRDADDVLDLRYGLWTPGGAAPERYVVLLNGRTEWIEKYAYVAGDLDLPPRTGVLTMDHRGQGASGGARAYVDDYGSYGRDTARVVEEVCGDKPYVVVAHSMGGLIALHATLTCKLKPRAMALCSPLLGLPDDPVPRPVAKPLSMVMTRLLKLGAIGTGGGKFTSIPFERNRLTHDVQLYRRMQNTPYRVPSATFGWVAATFAAIETCFDPEMLKRLNAPTLVIGGSAERVVDPAAFRAWVALASAHAKAEVDLRIIPGARHELLSEIPAYYQPTLALLREWIRKGFHASPEM